MGPEEGVRFTALLTTALEHDPTFEQDSLLEKVARGEAAMADFLERYGHRATNEMELGETRWREDPAYLEQIVAQMQRGGRSLDQMHHDNAAKSAEARRQLA